LILGFALVPTIIHSYAGMVVDDGLTTSRISPRLDGFTSGPPERDAQWGQRWFNSDDWFERRYVSGRDEVLLTVLRSYDWKGLYHHPELGIAHGSSFQSEDVKPLGSRFPMPVHVLRPEMDGGAGAVYALHYGNGFVENATWFQIGKAGELLFRGRRPMTIFFARDLVAPRDTNPEAYPSLRVLRAAVEQFLSAGAHVPAGQ
jgi:hypothetical protein